jgi:hypothetical protein
MIRLQGRAKADGDQIDESGSNCFNTAVFARLSLDGEDFCGNHLMRIALDLDLMRSPGMVKLGACWA